MMKEIAYEKGEKAETAKDSVCWEPRSLKRSGGVKVDEGSQDLDWEYAKGTYLTQ